MNIVVIGILIIIIIIFFIIFSPQPKEKEPNPITLEHIYRIFSHNSNLTSLQKTELWRKEFESKKVIWEGIVTYVNEHFDEDGLSYVLGVRHDAPEFYFPFDILISLPSSKEKEKLLSLKEGQSVRYSALLGFDYNIDYDYTLKRLRIHLHNGKILK